MDGEPLPSMMRNSPPTENNLESEGENSEDEKQMSLTVPMTAPGLRRTSYMDITVFTKDSGTCAETDLIDEIREAELFLRSLPEVSYQVVKTNLRGRRQSRTLRLDWEGLSNIKKKTVLTKKHKYSDVERVGLQNTNSFTISYANDHDFHYSSPIAVEIVQEISSRLSIRQATDKKKKNIGTEFDSALFQHTLLDSSSGDSEGRADDLGASGKLDGLTISEGDEYQSPAEGSPVHSPRSASLSPNASGRRTSVKPVRISNNKDRSAFKLYSLTGATEGQRIDLAVDRIIFDSASPEGRTIQHYINTFELVERNPATAPENTRQFIDGMRDYILTNRGEELSRLMINAPTETNRPDEMSLSQTIGIALEKAIIGVLYHRLMKCISVRIKKEEEALKKKIERVRQCDQNFLEIPEKNQSKRDWRQPCVELSQLNTKVTPTEKISCLLASARAVYNSHNHEKNMGVAPAERKKFLLAADDFLPIHIYVVARSDLVEPMLTVEYLMALGDPQHLTGEGGYYVTVFKSALMYILEMELPPEPEVVLQKKESNKRLSILGVGLSKSKKKEPWPLGSPSVGAKSPMHACSEEGAGTNAENGRQSPSPQHPSTDSKSLGESDDLFKSATTSPFEGGDTLSEEEYLSPRSTTS